MVKVIYDAQGRAKGDLNGNEPCAFCKTLWEGEARVRPAQASVPNGDNGYLPLQCADLLSASAASQGTNCSF